MIDTAETIRKALKSVDRKKRNTPYPPELRKRAAAYIRQQRCVLAASLHEIG